MQASLSVKRIPRIGGTLPHANQNASQYDGVSQGLQKHWCGCVVFLYGINQTREIWVNDSRKCCDHTKNHINSEVECGKEQQRNWDKSRIHNVSWSKN